MHREVDLVGKSRTWRQCDWNVAHAPSEMTIVSKAKNSIKGMPK